MMPISVTCIGKRCQLMIQPNKIAILALTQIGAELARKLQALLTQQVQVVLPDKLATKNEIGYAHGQFKVSLAQAFTDNEAIICIMATGIVVRSLAPMIQDKTCDPAVLVLDERGRHVISLLSGHVGGANALATQVGRVLQADPVITTATDTEGVQALDVLAKQLNAWYPEFKTNTKWINGRLAAGKPVALWIDTPFKSLFLNTKGFTIVDSLTAADPRIPIIAVTDRLLTEKREQLIPVIPRLDVLGIGCRKNVTNDMMLSAFSEFCQQEQLAWHAIGQLASIEKKAHESAIHELAATLHVPVHFYSAAQLQASSRRYPQSAFVQKTVGIGNVACSAADYASGSPVVTPRFARHEVTLALGRIQKIEMSE